MKKQQLVDYSSDEEDVRDCNSKKLCIKKDQTRIVYIQSNEQIEKSTHFQGTFPSFIYISINSFKPCQDLLSTLQINKQFEIVNQLHISLSANFQLTLHQIEEFVQKFKQMEDIISFKITFDSCFNIFQAKTQSYITIPILKGKKEIIDLITSFEQLVKDFGGNEYFKNPIPHVTLAIMIGDNENWLKNVDLQMLSGMTYEIKDINLKIGQRVNILELQKTR